LSFADRAALLREMGVNLTHGRAFVGGARGFELFAPCTLVLQHPERAQELHIACEVVMVQSEGPLAGIALQFTDRGERTRASLQAFVAAEPAAAANTAEEDEADPAEERDALSDEDEDAGEGPQAPRTRASQERRERLHNLSAAARIKVAQGAVLEDRVLLERIYGTVVWELLLHNPRITIPEVATMARKGTLPRPLLEFISNNELWIRQGIVRRALLANPRLPTDSALKVLRCLSPRELKLVPQQTAYPLNVRQAAQRLLRGG